MPQKIVTIDIDKEAGTFSVDTEGFHGQGCQAIHQAFGPWARSPRKPSSLSSTLGPATATE